MARGAVEVHVREMTLVVELREDPLDDGVATEGRLVSSAEDVRIRCVVLYLRAGVLVTGVAVQRRRERELPVRRLESSRRDQSVPAVDGEDRSR